jgi:glutathione synthase/RimK-type ligase-like ATP-grasp enzyme
MSLSGVVPHTLIDLPGAMACGVRSLMRRLGLIFGCIDVVEGENGEYYFLEVNPRGQWLWIEDLTGVPISKAIAEELCSA